jgi:AcrR family transcriptional regulator
MTAPITTTTKQDVLAAAKDSLIESGYSQLSTRRIAERAGVPLSQIHYHFRSKENLVLEVLAEENRRLLERQVEMYADDQPLWKQWEQACDYLDDDLESGYVRVLQEMMAAGWSDPAIATAVRALLEGWFTLLRSVATSALERLGTTGTVDPDHIAVWVGTTFLGAEAILLLGFEDATTRQALRSVAGIIRSMEEKAEVESSTP